MILKVGMVRGKDLRRLDAFPLLMTAVLLLGGGLILEEVGCRGQEALAAAKEDLTGGRTSGVGRRTTDDESEGGDESDSAGDSDGEEGEGEGKELQGRDKKKLKVSSSSTFSQGSAVGGVVASWFQGAARSFSRLLSGGISGQPSAVSSSAVRVNDQQGPGAGDDSEGEDEDSDDGEEENGNDAGGEAEAETEVVPTAFFCLTMRAILFHRRQYRELMQTLRWRAERIRLGEAVGADAAKKQWISDDDGHKARKQSQLDDLVSAQYESGGDREGEEEEREEDGENGSAGASEHGERDEEFPEDEDVGDVAPEASEGETSRKRKSVF
uniref:Uncharacterized protein n=1 Tax=Chromera velia CCMP2878 TaxID=1169474 RepID=A0A0G4FIE0_9ALVE|eukprot:Cvel_17163.t1-p1 / transcript=Cvel_17163.t1 / gene=Cvel_17163 / organism=Chromera_velia_CCMP2878 / gene_product=hypothetical protein / transcript_product=hypothetical protein / location=Cvel_scaffold1356:33407-35539(+) / protein_length=325 / sequence_SO=supercontig / SO=protein_coding / is_pseudo=false